MEEVNKREQYMSFLRDNTCKVTFTKVNGETRVMRCTLNQTLIPQVQVPQSLDEKAETGKSLEVIRVFDLDANGWRSFRVDSVTDFVVGA